MAVLAQCCDLTEMSMNWQIIKLKLRPDTQMKRKRVKEGENEWNKEMFKQKI